MPRTGQLTQHAVLLSLPAGTGVAPMMGFLQERAALAAQGASLGPAHLFFGCRSSAEDFIYRAELEGYLASGVLSGLHVAFSREGASKVSSTAAAAAAAEQASDSRLYVCNCRCGH
jgi:sulfite reductase alpha subunit-like flavoprotein